VLGLYVTAKEAYEKWRADPEQVKGRSAIAANMLAKAGFRNRP